MKKIVLPILLVAIIACEDQEEKQLNITEVQMEGLKDEVIYSIPSPSNFYEILEMVDKKVSDAETNPTANAESYVTKHDQSFNFGVYCSDLAFLAHFNHQEKILAYYRTLKSIGNDLGVAAVFSMGGLDALEDDVENSDSILKLASKTYEDAYQYLELKGRGEDLALMIAGGWVEGAYLVGSLVEDYDKDAELIERLYEEQFSLESIILNLEQYPNEDNENLKKELKAILDFYLAIEAKVKDKNEQSENGISGGNKPTMTKDEFLSLRNKIVELRNNQTKVD